MITLEPSNKQPAHGASIRALLAAAALVLSVLTPAAHAETATIAVAANFAAAVKSLQVPFEERTGHTLVFAFGSTGKLYAQIIHGAPFDVFLAADQERPALLEARGGVPGTRFTYATGRLTLWSPDPELLKDGSPTALSNPGVRHVAIANPKLAPYGLAARQALERLGLWVGVESKIVMGQDVGEAFAMVATGNAQAGFVALSLVLEAPGTAGSRWDVPAEFHEALRQDAVLLRHGADNPAAVAFLDFLRGEDARDLMRRHGYAVE
jgi:molybdate transport system substrate-binding protein